MDAIAILVVQLKLDPFQIGRRIRSKIHYDVVNLPPEAGEGLPLAMGSHLIVKSSQGESMTILGDVRLEHMRSYPVRRELPGAEMPTEDPALVDEGIWLDEKGTGQ